MITMLSIGVTALNAASPPGIAIRQQKQHITIPDRLQQASQPFCMPSAAGASSLIQTSKCLFAKKASCLHLKLELLTDTAERLIAVRGKAIVTTTGQHYFDSL
ncbi:hypothetical protein [Pseudomonas coronafaciens]|uniref:hypothetical protein n=1 Tax=Pseudomonas coronafaciens TaxID=53409 RepID=UPI00160501C9|nr:hypothetical protein [Pseudomonas coronafaciens]